MNNNINENYISRFAIGQVFLQDGKYWQVTKYTIPSNDDWFIGNITYQVTQFDVHSPRYIVQEVSVTPKSENKNKLPVGTSITVNDEFYEVTGYHIPQANEKYVYLGYGSPLIYTRCYGYDDASYNIVSKIEPYKRGQVITVDNKSYTVIDYACPKKDQFFLNTRYSAVYSAAYDWLTEKSFILEPIAPPDPEATVYKPGQLIVRKGLVYRVIAYRKVKKGEYMTYSGAPTAVICLDDESYSVRWVVEPYCVS